MRGSFVQQLRQACATQLEYWSETLLAAARAVAPPPDHASMVWTDLERVHGEAGVAISPSSDPDGPPEFWLALVRERAPQLLRERPNLRRFAVDDARNGQATMGTRTPWPAKLAPATGRRADASTARSKQAPESTGALRRPARVAPAAMPPSARLTHASKVSARPQTSRSAAATPDSAAAPTLTDRPSEPPSDWREPEPLGATRAVAAQSMKWQSASPGELTTEPAPPQTASPALSTRAARSALGRVSGMPSQRADPVLTLAERGQSPLSRAHSAIRPPPRSEHGSATGTEQALTAAVQAGPARSRPATVPAAQGPSRTPRMPLPFARSGASSDALHPAQRWPALSTPAEPWRPPSHPQTVPPALHASSELADAAPVAQGERTGRAYAASSATWRGPSMPLVEAEAPTWPVLPGRTEAVEAADGFVSFADLDRQLRSVRGL